LVCLRDTAEPDDRKIAYDRSSAGMKKNILHIIDTFGTGGAESVYLQLVDRLDPNRFRSFPAVLGDGWLRTSVIALGHRPIDTRTHGSFDLGYLKQLIGLIRSYRIDVIQTHLLTTAVYGTVAGRLTGTPVVCTFHGINDVKGRQLGLKSAIVSRGASQVVFVSEYLKRELICRGLFARSRNTVIYNGVDSVRFAPRTHASLRSDLGIANDEVLVGAVGRIIHAKGFDVLLRAAHLLRQHRVKFRFLIIGEKLADDDTDSVLLQLRGALGLDRDVHILPFRTDIECAFSSMDIFVLSSRTEGFSLTTVEAMASGLPVIATASGGPQEIITPGVDGIVVPPDAPEALAQALAMLVENPSLARRLSQRARETAVRRFSLERMVKQYEELYDSL
jgi:glycosyltransferase involved in cell wall biosynthesis